MMMMMMMGYDDYYDYYWMMIEYESEYRVEHEIEQSW